MDDRRRDLRLHQHQRRHRGARKQQMTALEKPRGRRRGAALPVSGRCRLRDLPMVRAWLAAAARAREWWGEPGSSNSGWSATRSAASRAMRPVHRLATARPAVRLSAVLLDHRRAWVADNGLGVASPPGTRGIDQFDRRAGYARSRARLRHSSAQFVEGLLAAGTPRMITDPDPANARAIRAYEKAGFRADREVDTPDGRALLDDPRQP